MLNEFSANISEEVLKDLKLRLNNTRWPDEIKGSGWEYGTNLSYRKELVEYWRTEFNWRKVENEINKEGGGGTFGKCYLAQGDTNHPIIHQDTVNKTKSCPEKYGSKLAGAIRCPRSFVVFHQHFQGAGCNGDSS